MLSVTDPMGGQTFVSYEKDGVGMASYQTAEGYVWSYAYDPAGRCMLVQGEESRLDYAYNHLDYPVRVTDALGHTTKYRYDHLCNLTKRVLPNQYDRVLEDGVGTEYVYDEMDELICRIDPLGNVFATPGIWRKTSAGKYIRSAMIQRRGGRRYPLCVRCRGSPHSDTLPRRGNGAHPV